LLFRHFTTLGRIETGYGIMFIVCGLAYVTAWLVMHFIVPRNEKGGGVYKVTSDE